MFIASHITDVVSGDYLESNVEFVNATSATVKILVYLLTTEVSTIP